MSSLQHRLAEDRSLRNAALKLVKADIAHLRTDVAERSIKTRITDRATEGTVDLLEQATELANDNPGALAALIGAITLWLARNPIADLFGRTSDDDYDEAT